MVDRVHMTIEPCIIFGLSTVAAAQQQHQKLHVIIELCIIMGLSMSS